MHHFSWRFARTHKMYIHLYFSEYRLCCDDDSLLNVKLCKRYFGVSQFHARVSMVLCESEYVCALDTTKKTKRFLLKSDLKCVFCFSHFVLPNVSVEFSVNGSNEIYSNMAKPFHNCVSGWVVCVLFVVRSDEPCRIYTFKCLCTQWKCAPFSPPLPRAKTYFFRSHTNVLVQLNESYCVAGRQCVICVTSMHFRSHIQKFQKKIYSHRGRTFLLPNRFSISIVKGQQAQKRIASIHFIPLPFSIQFLDFSLAFILMSACSFSFSTCRQIQAESTDFAGAPKTFRWRLCVCVCEIQLWIFSHTKCMNLCVPFRFELDAWRALCRCRDISVTAKRLNICVLRSQFVFGRFSRFTNQNSSKFYSFCCTSSCEMLLHFRSPV